MSDGGRSAADLAAGVRDGQVSSRELASAALAAIERVESGPTPLNAVLYRDHETANESTLVTQGPLAGVPVVVKDNIATLRMPTSCGSRILDGYVSPFEATVVTRLRAAGATIVGKTNMDEFAMGSSTENSAFGPTRNPLSPDRVPGGSSGGSAAAVAAGVVRIALGSETGGSVRQPAAFCGIVGVKPTYGRVSRHGLVAFASSLDQVGVFGRTVDDAALALEMIAGADPLDATSTTGTPISYRSAGRTADAAEGERPLAGLVIGRPREYFPESLDAGIRAACDRALDTLRGLGADVRDVSLPHTELAIPVYYIVAPAEASSNLARFDGVRYGMRVERSGLRAMYEATRSRGFGPEVTRRIMLGTYVLSAGYYDAYYLRAQEVRRRIRRDFTRVFASGVHALFTPTAPTVAFPIGAVSDPYELYLSDIFTVTANLAGIPGMSQPIGRVGGLPVGGQLLAPHFEEATMFRVAAALERGLGGSANA
ncbi:MAG: Asp-tRNA(Asn)/Glu-tRNA(Gln) amidotransferase subunit GatA [Gemmatimonadota bacterium]